MVESVPALQTPAHILQLQRQRLRQWSPCWRHASNDLEAASRQLTEHGQEIPSCLWAQQIVRCHRRGDKLASAVIADVPDVFFFLNLKVFIKE